MIISNQKKIFLFTLFAILIILAEILPISGDEAYYWNCSKNFDWAYFDQPPLIIWSSGLFSLFYKSNLSVRFPSLIFTFLTFLLLYKWLKNDCIGLFLLTSSAPILFFGSFYLSTDKPLSFFYLWSTYILLKINEKNSIYLWFLLGISFGLGFLSKFPMVLILPIIFYIAYKKANLFQFFIFSVMSLVITSPVLIYAFQNDWANITFQILERHKENSNLFKMILHLWVPNLILIGPLFFLKGIYEIIRNWKKNLILFFSGIIPILFFTIAGFKNPGAPHWILLGFYSLSILQMKNWNKKELKISFFINIFIIIIFLLVLSFPNLFYKLKPSIFGNFLDFKILKEEIFKEKLKDEVLISPSYTIVSLLNYHSGKKDLVYLFNINRGIHGLSFLYWQKNLEFIKENYLLISNKKLREKILEKYFEKVEMKILKLQNKGISKEFYLYHCKKIKTRAPFYPY